MSQTTTESKEKVETKKKGQEKSEEKQRTKKGWFVTDPVSYEQYNVMWTTYLETQSIAECARRANVNQKTAQKYINGKASPKRGMEPIAERFRRIQSAAKKEEDLTYQRFCSEQLKLVIELLNIQMGEIYLVHEDTKKRVDEYKANKAKGGDPVSLPQKDVVRNLDSMIRLGMRLMGGPDQTLEHKDSRFANWTDEEKMLFLEKGIRPDHDR